MKKKHRNINIDGDSSWAWRVKESGDDFYYNVNITIWKDKKVMYQKGYGYMAPQTKRYSITPGLIARFIKRHLVK